MARHAGRAGAAGLRRRACRRPAASRCSCRPTRPWPTTRRRCSTASTAWCWWAGTTSIRRSTARESHPLTDPPNVRRDASELGSAARRHRPRDAGARRLPRRAIAQRRVRRRPRAAPRRRLRARAAPPRARHLRPPSGGRRRRAAARPRRRPRRGRPLAPPPGAGTRGRGADRHGARAEDGTVEALEDPSLPFCVGVLWHPEEDPIGAGAPLFRGLVDRARAYALARA